MSELNGKGPANNDVEQAVDLVFASKNRQIKNMIMAQEWECGVRRV